MALSLSFPKRALLAFGAVFAIGGISAPATAGVVFQWECRDTAACTNPGGVFEGYVEFGDAFAAAGTSYTNGTGGRILDFFFRSTVPAGGGTWLLSGLVASNPLSDIRWSISSDGQTLDAFTTVSNNFQCINQSAGDICLVDSVTFGQVLNIRANAQSVEDVFAAELGGRWVRQSVAVPEPGTLSIAGLALAALVAMRRRKQ